MANADLDELMNVLIPFAQQMLGKHGEFFPFGASMRTDGKVECHAADAGEEQPASEKLIEMLTGAFRQQVADGTIRAAGICYDVRTIPPGQTEKTDAICLALEHQGGDAAQVYLPYRKGWFGRVKYGELFAGAREKQFFA